MASLAVIVIVFVALGEARDPSTEAMANAARDALGADARVEVRELATEVSDADAVALDTSASVAVADVRWLDPQRSHAHLRLRAHGAARWVDRDVGFDPVDAPAERGRALGFTLASMLPSRLEGPISTPIVVAPPPVAPPPPVVDVRPAPRREEHPPRPFVGALHAAGVVTTGIGGYAGSLGAGLAGEWQVAAPLALRLGGAVRSGEVLPAQATSLVVTGGVGVVVTFVRATSAQRLGLGARAAGLVQLQSVAHLSSGDPTSTRLSRVLPGAELLVEGSFALTDSASLVVGAGGEAAFGTTEIFSRGALVASIPPLRAAFELGLRARF